MKGFKKISTRIFIGIFAGTLLVMSLTSIVDYFYTKNFISGIVKNLVENSLTSAYNELATEIAPIIAHAEGSAYFISEYNISENEIKNLMNYTLTRYSKFVGVGVKEYSNNQELYSFYLARDSIENDSGINLMRCNEGVLHGSKQPNKEYSIRITFQFDTVSFFYHLIDLEKSLCIRYDMHVQNFIDVIERHTKILPSRHYIFDLHNNAILSTSKRYSDISSEEQENEIKVIGSYLDEGEEGLIVSADLGDRAIFIGSLKGTDYKLASSLQINEILKRFRLHMGLSYLISILALVILAYLLQRIITRITRPLTELTDISKKIQQGSLHTEVPVYSGDGETAQLSDALRSVQSKMQRYVSSLNSTLKTKRAMEHELKIANKIQFDMIPGAHQALTERPEIDLYAEIIPAKGVAGDFYDYFFLDKKNLFFVIGDVSGKGIPAALFMVKTVTLIKAAARKNANPALVFKEVNEQLCLKNDESMFVTAIAGVINIYTGEASLCDAGHNAPIFALNGQKFKYTDLNKCMPLGIMPDRDYKETGFQLNKMDSLLFYTDGFPECLGFKGEMLGEEALEQSLVEMEKRPLSEISNLLWNLIQDYRNGTPANDDTTIIIIRFLGDSVFDKN